MATTKKTAAKKTTVAPKKQHSAVEKREARPAEQLSLPKKPEPVEAERQISYVIPLDKSLESNDQYFEWNRNGINYRFKRGEVLTHPESMYKAITDKLFAREHVSPFIAEFMNTSKKLN